MINSNSLIGIGKQTTDQMLRNEMILSAKQMNSNSNSNSNSILNSNSNEL